MKVIRQTDRDFTKQLRALSAASNLFNPEIEQRTRAVIDAVRERGDTALLQRRSSAAGIQLPGAQKRAASSTKVCGGGGPERTWPVG